MGRVVVITGGTSGIGLCLKELFEKNGDTVLTFSIDEIENENHYVGSVSHDIKVRQVFNDIHERFGNIDILINNAGIGMSAITEIAPMEDIRNVMDINFFGTLYCTRAALPHMNSGSRIINMSSAMALFPVPFRSIYGSAKAAVLNLSQSMRMELAPLGIDVVAICPGDTKTNFTKSRLKDFTTTERYGDRLETATLSSDAREEKRMTPEYVAGEIFKVINKKKTRPFYIIGGKYKGLYFLTRLTSRNLLLKQTAKLLGGVEKKPEPKQKKIKEKKVKEDSIKVEETTPVQEEQIATPVAEVIAQAEPKEEPQEAETSTEAKTNISSILSKISILNKPKNEQEDTVESSKETQETQQEDETQVASEESATEEEKKEE